MDSLGADSGPVSDLELMVRSGEQPELFGVLFDRHFPVIHRYLARRAGGDVADDLAADVFTVAFERRASFEPDLVRAAGSVLPWLYGIASNLLQAHFRHVQRDQRLISKVGLAPVGEAHDTGIENAVTSAVAAAAQVRELGPALAALTEEELTTLLLHAWEDLSYAEIAAATRVPIGTVRSRLHRVRRRLREPVRAVRTRSDDNDRDEEGAR